MAKEVGYINNDTQNVTVGKGRVTGYLFVAPNGTALPTDATTDLPEAYKNLGYIDEDGVTETVDTSSEDIKDINGDILLTEITENKKTWQFKLLEIRADVLKFVFGDDNVTLDEQGNVKGWKDTAPAYKNCVLVREHVLSNGQRLRVIAPLAKITELGDREYQSGEAVKYDVTVTLTKDTNNVREYSYKG